MLPLLSKSDTQRIPVIVLPREGRKEYAPAGPGQPVDTGHYAGANRRGADSAVLRRTCVAEAVARSRRVPPAAGCVGVICHVARSVTVYFDNHYNLYEYSPRFGEANRSLPGDRLPVPEKATVGPVFGKGREPNQSIHGLLGRAGCAGASHVSPNPSRAHGVDLHVPPYRLRHLDRQGVERRLGDGVGGRAQTFAERTTAG